MSPTPRMARAGRSALLLLALGLLLPAAPTGAQEPGDGQPAPPATAEPAERPPVEEFGKPMGPPDPFNRGTPRGTMYGFIVAARANDWERATQFLDLRRLPPELKDQETELARQFKVVLDQTLWLDFATLSDSNDGYPEDGLPGYQERLADVETPDGLIPLLLQRVPRKDDGVRIWKVSATTVAQIPELYELLGPRWVEAHLPSAFLTIQLLELALWQWAAIALFALLASLLSLLVAGTFVRLLGLALTRAKRTLDPRIVGLVQGPVRLAIGVGLFALAHHLLALPLPALRVVRVFERVLLVLAAAWLVFRFIDLAALALRVRAEKLGNLGVVPALVPGARFAKFLVLVFGFLGIFGTMGVNISAALAGLGVGGIAVALAAQKSIENLFGGVTLFADQPVRVGDFFKFGDKVGTVEEIGLRSTRVRTLDRTVISIPNGEFSNYALENFAVRDRMRLWTMIGVRYETTPDQLRFLLARLRQLLLAHPRITDDPARVRFVGFGAYSLDLEVFAYVDTLDWSELLEVREDLYLRFMDAVAEAGTGFAFPSSTTYVGRDDGLDPEAAAQAEKRVAEWRDQGHLPFPRFSEEDRRQVYNTLEWPPEGSPDAPARRPRPPDGADGV